MTAILDNGPAQNNEPPQGNDKLAQNNELAQDNQPVLTNEPAQNRETAQRKGAGISPLYGGLALFATLIVGVVIGYLFSQAQTSQNAPIQVVVTATPDPNSQPAGASANQLSTPAPAQTNASPTTSAAANPNAPPTPTIMELVLADARHFEGSPDAPVTMIEFSDFKCPYCGRFAAETLPRIRAEYIKTGKVRFVYKHFAILGPESNRAAEASECAAEQGLFWVYHDAIFADQTSIRSTLDDNRLTELAGQVGADTTAFKECLNSGRYTAPVTQQSLSVQALGFRGTPSFLINGVAMTGAQPYELFQQTIEGQLGNQPVPVNPTPTAPAPVTATPAASTPPTSTPPDQTSADPDEDIEGVVFFPNPSKEHQPGKIDYPQVVPPGGKHSDTWQNCGTYDEPLQLEPVVHSLEHGAVWIAYQPDLPTDQIELLSKLVRQERQTRGEPLILLAPQSGLEAPIVATAWQAQLQLDDAADERLPQFLSRYQNGSFTPEPGAPCTGGVGEPAE
ncbi:MAG: hypothetical protein BroJett011_09730 [Chloroflexota bacterium]|nr:MAG: hypothetical protein BroJett011_09730 [Chloroflexota bacterium]